MRPPRFSPSTLLLSIGLAAAAASAPAAAQDKTNEGQITGTISAPGLVRLSLAVPAFRVSPIIPAALRAAAGEIEQTVIADLDYSGYFDVIPPGRFETIGDDPSKIPFQQWAATGAIALLLGTVTPEPDKLIFEGMLFDTQGEQLILGKRYRGEAEAARLIAHRLADEIVLHFTGRSGIAQTRIALEGRVGDAKEIFVVDYDGHGLRQLTRNGSLNLAPSASPDGTRIAFISYVSGRPKLYILEPDAKLVDISPKDVDLCAAPAWSPDGQSIAFSAASSGNSDIYIHDVGRRASRRITSGPGSDTSPAWSPSGREIAYTSDRAGNPQLYIMDSAGGEGRRLTFQGNYNDQAAWSPDGSLIAYAGWTEGKFDIFVADPATGTARRLTEGPSFNEGPGWSSDGRHLVFISNRIGVYQLFSMDIDGGRQVRLQTPFETFSPVWTR